MPRQASSAIVQILHGNPNRRTKEQLQKRVKNEKKLQFSSDNLKPPSWLSTGAKKVFKTVVDLYKDTTFLNDADVVTLAQYCDWYSEYMACNRRLKKNGRVIGNKPNPDLRMKLQISAELDRLARELGLTPAARASLSIHASDAYDTAKEMKENDDDFE